MVDVCPHQPLKLKNLNKQILKGKVRRLRNSRQSVKSV